MNLLSTRAREFQPNPEKSNIESGTQSTRIIVTLAASLLIVSSAGMGCYYAWSQGEGHGWILAGLAVAMALGLELCKPFAIEAVFSSLRSFAFVRALTMLTLAALAIAYSLSAELSLIATTRGDAVAQRAASARAATSADSQRQRIEVELNTLGVTRPIGEIAAEMQGVLTTNKIEACEGWLPSRQRNLCAEVVQPLKAEMSRSARRDILERELHAMTAAPLASITTADPGAKALSIYLAAFGLQVSADQLSEYLILVAVLALEIGSALSVVLVRSVAPRVQQRVSYETGVDRAAPAVARPATVPDGDLDTPRRSVGKIGRTTTETRILATLAESGGSLSETSVRGLASKIGARKSTVHNALAGLLAAGVVERVGEQLILRGAA